MPRAKKFTPTLAAQLASEDKRQKNLKIVAMDVPEDVKKLQDNIFDLVSKTYAHFETIYFPDWNQAYKDDKLYMWDRYIDLVKNKQERRTNNKTPLIATAKDTFVGNMFDPNTNIKAVPVSPKWEKALDGYQKFADSVFTNSDVLETLRQCVDEAILTGNSYARVGFRKEKSEKQYLKNGEVEKIEIEYANPVLDYVSIYELVFDIGAKSFDTTRRKAYRTISDYNSAAKKYEWIFKVKITEEIKNDIINNPQYVSQYNYNKIKEIKFYEREIYKTCENYYETNKNRTNVKPFTEESIYQIQYKHNNLIEIIEYREKDRCVVEFNWHKIYDGINPYPFHEDPFVQLQYEKTTGIIIARWLWQKLRWFQQSIDLIYNLYMDAVKINSAPMFKQMGGTNKEKVFYYEPRAIRPDTWQDLESMKLVDMGSIQSALGAINQIQSDSDRTAWLSDYTSGWESGGIERSYGGAMLKAQSLKNRLKPLIDSINRFLTNVIRKCAVMATTYMEENFPVRIIGENNKASFENVSAEDLVHNFDIVFDNSLSATREIDFAKKLQLLQSVVPINTDPMRWNQPIADLKPLIEWLVRDASISGEVVISDEQRKKILEDYQTFIQSVQWAQAPAGPEWQEVPSMGALMGWAPWATPWVSAWEAPVPTAWPRKRVNTNETAKIANQI